jgi:prolyl-tRNA synthetase
VKASQLFIPTLREDPGDAEAASHRLLVRGAFIRQVSAGLWTFLPLGWRVHQKAVQIVREEMNAIGGQEMFMPVVTPAELWQLSGRYVIPELWKTADRLGRPFVLAMTHEETITFHAREIRSYRELPQIVYHFQTKVRDEPRPRGGLIRVREFVMKDAYSFDRDEDGLERSFRLHEGAYHRIFERCGLEFYAVQAESGMMGGSSSVDFLAPSGSGENTLVTCERGDYAADLEVARGVPRPPEFPKRLDAPVQVETPGITTIETLAEFLGLDPAATSKAMPVVKLDGTLVLGLLRGDDRLEEAKMTAALGSGFRPATETEIREAFGADPGSIGPVGFDAELVADEALRDGQFVTGANRTGWHLRGVEQGRDFEARFADIREPREGDTCPKCGGRLRFQTALEVGHIFKLETEFSEPLGATFLDETGQERPLVMGSYGIGPGRILAAAVEQNHDGQGIAWPAPLAPYDVHVVVLPGVEEAGEALTAELEAAGTEVILDDRAARAGEKFADADLIGCPVRVTVGKKLEQGIIDVRARAGGEDRQIEVAKVPGVVRELLGHGP